MYSSSIIYVHYIIIIKINYVRIPILFIYLLFLHQLIKANLSRSNTNSEIPFHVLCPWTIEKKRQNNACMYPKKNRALACWLMAPCAGYMDLIIPIHMHKDLDLEMKTRLFITIYVIVSRERRHTNGKFAYQ